ncbi:MAG: Na/Pi cotransporter family protein [Deltaproteobacteria bacterium]|nr:Na/Pi cotransporter family protein [Deltaproteobacteria bacterium]
MNKSILKIIKFVLPAALCFMFLDAQFCFAGEEKVQSISWGYLIIGLFGGLALFLYGMDKMSTGMKKSAGDKMRSILAALTQNRVIGMIVGAFVTMVVQSSSATTVMLVSFVQAGLMTFVQSLGVILGADIGTTVTAQLIAFKLTDYALLMIAVGFGLQIASKKENIKNLGEVVLGFGILFFGMKLMSDAMIPLKTHSQFIGLMKDMENPFLGLLAGTIFTALVQSSSATTGIVIVLAQQGLINLEGGIPIIFGANIGTCVTACLACIGTTRDAKRVALAHVLFKVAGVLLFIFWIPDFAAFIRLTASKFGFGTARQIANAHTIFNVGLAILFLPAIGVFAKIIQKILPDEYIDDGIIPKTWHIDDSFIQTPSIATDLARVEMSRMAKLLRRMLRAIIIPFMSDENLICGDELTKEERKLLIKEIPTQDEHFPQLSLIEGLDMREQKIDFLDKKIREYLIKISKQNVSQNQANEIYAMISITSDMESIGDIIHRNLVPLIDKKRNLCVDFSEEGKEELMIYHQKVCNQITLLEEAFTELNPEKAKEIMAGEKKYLDLESQYRIQHLERVLYKRQESSETHEVHMELMDMMKQIVVYSSNIAKTFLNKIAA